MTRCWRKRPSSGNCEGEKEETESVGQLVKARIFLKKRYGRAYIQFSAPISLNEYLARNPNYHLEQPEDIRKLSLDLSFRVIRIDQPRVRTSSPFLKTG